MSDDRPLIDAYRKVFRAGDEAEARGWPLSREENEQAHADCWRLERGLSKAEQRAVWQQALNEHEAER